MNDDSASADGPLAAEQKRDRAAKARAAAVAKRKREGSTPAQLAAIKRMQEGRKAAAAQRRRIKDGGSAPVVKRQEAGPVVEPAAYPERPAVVIPREGRPAAKDAGHEQDAAPGDAGSNPAPPIETTTTKTTGGVGAWLRKGMGL